MIVMSGTGSVRRTVRSSTRSITPSAMRPVPGSIIEVRRDAIELPSTDWSHQRSKLNITSSAAKASPLLQVTPGRRRSV